MLAKKSPFKANYTLHKKTRVFFRMLQLFFASHLVVSLYLYINVQYIFVNILRQIIMKHIGTSYSTNITPLIYHVILFVNISLYYKTAL